MPIEPSIHNYFERPVGLGRAVGLLAFCAASLRDMAIRPVLRDNFLAEVKFLQDCDHPAVMRVFDEGLHLDEQSFVVAEYLPNTIGKVFGTTPSMMAKMAYAVQLLSALEYLSMPEMMVVHRDIKPENVFIKGGSCACSGLLHRGRTWQTPF